MKDKRTIIWECLQDRATSADAILNALHQAGWAIVPKDAVRIVYEEYGPEWTTPT